jgi:N-acetylglucosamine-6-phosphate deacetylase
MEALVNGRVLVDEGFVEGHAVLLEGAHIVGVVREGDPRIRQASRRDLEGHTLLPGFIDVQVNGGGGALFNDDPDVAKIRTIGEAHRRFGTTGLLPTLISEDANVVGRALEAVRNAMRANVPGVLGIHVEGPFINKARRGVHEAGKIRGLQPRDLEQLASLGIGRTLVTLAPELTDAATVRALIAKGVILSAGHTDATFEQMMAAMDAGVTGVTHLFNAMSPLHHRMPGAVAAALTHPGCWCGLIVDGHHVHPAALKIALAAKRADRFMLVTDAMSCVGTEAESFMLQGEKIIVRNGTCIDERGTLAGSALDMAGAVRNSIEMLGLPLERAARMASTYPAEFLGLGGELGRIATGYRASLTLLDEKLRAVSTWIDGRGA